MLRKTDRQIKEQIMRDNIFLFWLTVLWSFFFLKYVFFEKMIFGIVSIVFLLMLVFLLESREHKKLMLEMRYLNKKCRM